MADDVDAPAEIVAMVNEADGVSEEVQDGTDIERANDCVGGVRYELSWIVSTPNLNVAGEEVQTGFWSEFMVGAVVTILGE